MDKLDYQHILTSLPEALLILSRDFRILEVTKGYLKATNTSRHQLVDKNIFDVFLDCPAGPCPVGLRNLKSSLEKILITHEIDVMETEGFQGRSWEAVNIPISDETGSVYCILHKISDVTNFVKYKKNYIYSFLENSRCLNAYQRLRIIDDRYHALIDVIPTIVWEADFNGHFTYLNDWWYEYTGLTQEQSLGINWPAAFDPEQVGKIMASMKEIVKTKQGFSLRVRLKNRAGEFKPYFFKAMPLKNFDQTLSHIVGTMVEVESIAENIQRTS